MRGGGEVVEEEGREGRRVEVGEGGGESGTSSKDILPSASLKHSPALMSFASVD